MSLFRRLATILLVLLVMATMVPQLGLTAEADRAPIFLDQAVNQCDPGAWKQYQAWAKQYYPDIVNFDAPVAGNGFNNFVKKLTMAPTTREQIDAFPSGVARFTPEWAESGIIRPVDDLLQYAPNVKKYLDKYPGARRTWTYKGKLYAFPNAGAMPNWDGWAWLWRKDVLKNCGFSRIPSTIQELETFCATAKKKYPKMLPLACSISEFVRVISYPVNGQLHYLNRMPDGGIAVFWLTQSGKELAKYINKYIRNGWLSADVDVAKAKDGGYCANMFEAGNTAAFIITPYNAATGKTWDRVLKAHPAWSPILAKAKIFAADGNARSASNWNIYESAVQFTASGIGNEKAQIRLAKFLNFVFDPRNQWFNCTMGYGPNGFNYNYQVYPAANRFMVTKVSSTQKSWDGIWVPSVGYDVNVLGANAPRSEKLMRQVVQVRMRTEKGIISNPFNDFIEVEPPGIWEKYPGCLTYRTWDRWVAICSSMSGDIDRLWERHAFGLKAAGYPSANKEIAEGYKQLMGNDYQACFNWLKPSTY